VSKFPLILALLILFGGFDAFAQSFSTKVLMRDIGGAWDAVARDFDSDGDVDVLASTWIPGGVFYGEHRPGDTLYVAEAYVAGGTGRDVTAGDLDNDGDVDGLFASYGEDRYILLRNVPGTTPAERFEEEFLFDGATGPFAVDAVDFSGDGETDLIATELRASTNRIRLFEQIGGSLVEIWMNTIPEDPLALTTADLNGDGVMEILIAAANGGGLYVMRRTESGSYTITQDIPNYYLSAIAAGDVDNDGRVDIICGEFEDDNFRRWEWNGTGWTTFTLPGSLNNPRGVVIADFDSDGLLDFAGSAEGQEESGGGLAWWRQNANGSFVFQSLSNQSGFIGLEQADFDRDGDIDLLVANRALEQLILYRNLMGSPTRVIGTISSDRSGEAIAGARVTALETGVSAISDAAGRYELGMIEGTFTLRIEHACWATMDIGGVETHDQDTTFQDFSLRRAELDLPVTSLNLFVQNDVASTYEYWIGNTGDAELHVETTPVGFAPEDSWISVAPAQLTVPPGEVGLLTVTLTPDTSNDGNYDFLGSLEMRTNSCPDTIVDVALVVIVLDAPEANAGLIPKETGLLPAYPNPFNPDVTIPVAIAQSGAYELAVYNLLGRRVAVLFDGVVPAGQLSFKWQAQAHASGRYMAVLSAASGARWETSLMLIK